MRRICTVGKRREEKAMCLCMGMYCQIDMISGGAADFCQRMRTAE